MPRLREKNACPRALMSTLLSNFEKSGCRKYFTPSIAFGSCNDTPQNTNKITNSRGIKIFDIFSMPFFTPRSNTNRLRNIIIAVQKIGDHVDRIASFIVPSKPLAPEPSLLLWEIPISFPVSARVRCSRIFWMREYARMWSLSIYSDSQTRVI